MMDACMAKCLRGDPFSFRIFLVMSLLFVDSVAVRKRLWLVRFRVGVAFFSFSMFYSAKEIREG